MRVTDDGGGERDRELWPNAVYAHDPVLIPEQAHSNMAACTTTERGGLEGREFVLCSVLLGFFRPLTDDHSTSKNLSSHFVFMEFKKLILKNV